MSVLLKGKWHLGRTRHLLANKLACAVAAAAALAAAAAAAAIQPCKRARTGKLCTVTSVPFARPQQADSGGPACEYRT